MNRQVRTLKFIFQVESQLRTEGKAFMPDDEYGLASDVHEVLRQRTSATICIWQKPKMAAKSSFCPSIIWAADCDTVVSYSEPWALQHIQLVSATMQRIGSLNSRPWGNPRLSFAVSRNRAINGEKLLFLI